MRRFCLQLIVNGNQNQLKDIFGRSAHLVLCLIRGSSGAPAAALVTSFQRLLGAKDVPGLTSVYGLLCMCEEHWIGLDLEWIGRD